MKHIETDLPVKIKRCPIEEVVLEIRYSSETPSDAIFGILYGSIGKQFKKGAWF